jgi:hypothetical protein
MTKPVELTHSQWNSLYKEILKDYPPSVALIRSRMKEKLGFVNREYREYNKNTNVYKNCVMLDFYSEKKRTFFLMKYSEILNDKEKTV